MISPCDDRDGGAAPPARKPPQEEPMSDHARDESIDALRRRLLQAGAGAAALTTLPAISTASAQAPFDWKQFKGEKIEVNLIKSPRGELLTRYQKEFEDLTGIGVGSEMSPEQQQRQKAVIEFNSGKTSFDVIQLSYHVQKSQFGRGKWLVDLRPYIANPKLAPPDLDLADFSKGGMAYATQPDGRIDSLPINLDLWIIYWNKDLFAAKGVAYPKNYSEIMDAAAKLNDPAKGVFGAVGRGLKNANVPLWGNFFLGWGGEYIGPGGKLLTDTPEAIASATFYRDLLRNYGPPGVAGFNWNESQGLFMQGKAAMWIDGIGFAPPLEDPAKSKVVGKVGYGVMPPGPKLQVSDAFGDGIGVSSFSSKKDPAWLYVQWATNKQNQARLLQAGAGAPVRLSAFSDKQALANIAVPAAWLEAVAGSLRIAKPGLPIIEPVTEFRDVFGIALTNMINGADPAAELRKATAEFQPVLTKSEKA
jgi:multiple sugar transport system substrate-binding protein